MRLTYEFQIFLWIVLGNALLTAGYTLACMRRKREKFRSILLRALVMLLCPAVGPLYVFLSWLFFTTLFHKPVNLEDVLIAKDQENLLINAEEDKERNLIPIEDALLINDKDDARALFLDVIKRDPKKSLYSISLALDSEDSELSHYAASIIQAELDKTRKIIQEHGDRIFALEEELSAREQEGEPLRTEAGAQFAKARQAKQSARREEQSLEKDAPGKDGYYADIAPELENSRDYLRHRVQAVRQSLLARNGEPEERKTMQRKLTDEMAAAHALFVEVYGLLRQRLLTEFESSRYTDTLSRIGGLVEKRDVLSPLEYRILVQSNLDAGEMEKAAAWGEKAILFYPNSIDAHAAIVKLRFAAGDREGFFTALEEMKRADMVLDKEMLDLVRFFK